MRRSVVWEREGVESSVAVQAIAGLSFVVNGKVDGNARNDAPDAGDGRHARAPCCARPRAARSSSASARGARPAGSPPCRAWSARTWWSWSRRSSRWPACARPVNRDAMDNPRVHVTTGRRPRGAHWRAASDTTSSSPSPRTPTGRASRASSPGSSTRPSPRACEPDGVFLQWVQAYEVDERTISTVVATLATVFPEVEVWQVHQIDLLLVASRQPAAPRRRRPPRAHPRGALRERPPRGLAGRRSSRTCSRASWRARPSPGDVRRTTARSSTPTTATRSSSPSPGRSRESGLFDVVPAAPGRGRPRRGPPRARPGRRLGPRGAPAARHLHDRRQRRRRRSPSLGRGARPRRGARPVPRGRPRPRPSRRFEGQPGAAGGAGGDDALRGRPRRGRRPPRGRPTSRPSGRSTPTEAEAATARLALRLDQPELARDALVVGLRALPHRPLGRRRSACPTPSPSPTS